MFSLPNPFEEIFCSQPWKPSYRENVLYSRTQKNWPSKNKEDWRIEQQEEVEIEDNSEREKEISTG